MWPFTSRRILGNRWWALAFVAFVCWQIMEMAGPEVPANQSGDNAEDIQALAGVLSIK